MIHKLTFLFIFNFLFFGLMAQTNTKFVMIRTIDRGDYFYIPRYTFEDSVIAVLAQDKIETKTNPENRTLTIHWTSLCMGGAYYMTITPEQIYFSDCHVTPNPNVLYWVIEINREQYQRIRDGILKNPPSGFEDISDNKPENHYAFYENSFKDKFTYPPKIWTDSARIAYDKNCEEQIKEQLKKYFILLNSYIDNELLKIIVNESELMKMKPKYFSEFEYIIKDYWGIPELLEKDNKIKTK